MAYSHFTVTVGADVVLMKDSSARAVYD